VAEVPMSRDGVRGRSSDARQGKGCFDSNNRKARFSKAQFAAVAAKARV
jgi:hypothetical protein